MARANLGLKSYKRQMLSFSTERIVLKEPIAPCPVDGS
jgi:hypothetical protein